jgi:hypothetical protein
MGFSFLPLSDAALGEMLIDCVEGDGRYHVRADVDSEILRDAAERLVARGKPRREANARAVADERARIAGEIREAARDGLIGPKSLGIIVKIVEAKDE